MSELSDAVQVERFPGTNDFYVVATEELVEPLVFFRASIIRVDPDGSYGEKISAINSALCGASVFEEQRPNAYEIGGGKTVVGDGKRCERDYAVTPIKIPDEFVERALNVRDREKIELRGNFF